MRTSLRETERIERYLLNKDSAPQRLSFEAALLLDDGLKEKLEEQREAYELIKFYGRKKLQAEIREVHQLLFRQPKYSGFRNKVLNLFNHRK